MVVAINVGIHVEDEWESDFIIDFNSFEGIVIKVESSEDEAK
jgi:hypothetical protein